MAADYIYDAYGQTRGIKGTLATTIGYRNPLRYRSYIWDTELGLFYLQSRYYSPKIGRFINADDFEILLEDYGGGQTLKKVIVVRKSKAQRAGNCFLFAIMVCAATTACLLWSPFVQTFLLFFPVILPMFFVMLYYETWQVSFFPSKITFKYLFVRAKTYSYHQITDAYVAYSYTLHEHICLTFSDGKSIRFRAEDENYGIARRRIQSHRSIRTLNS